MSNDDSWKIPQTDIDAANYDILEVISKRIDLKRTGKNWSARCPFHKEKSASFTVNEAKGMYYCFGCGAGGGAIKFVMEYESMSFRDAVQSIIGRMAVSVTPEMVKKKAESQRVNYPPGNCEDPDKAEALLSRLTWADQHPYLLSRNTAPHERVASLNGVLMVPVERSNKLLNIAAIRNNRIDWVAGGPTYGATYDVLPCNIADPDNFIHDGEIILCLSYADAWRVWWRRGGRSIVRAAIDPDNFTWMQYQQKHFFTMVAAYPEEIEDLLERGHAVYPITRDPYVKLDTGTPSA